MKMSLEWTGMGTIQYAKPVLTRDSSIPFAHASLKLYAQLRRVTEITDPNDDLLDVWKETEAPIAVGLVNLLKHSQHFPDESHIPLKMTNQVLARQIAQVPMKHLQATEELFPLLYVESQYVQQTAFDILHKQIPAAQEKISIDAALEKSTARLPEELMSLILEAPSVAAFSEADFDRSIPLPLRGYLYSWLLVFDHLAHSVSKRLLLYSRLANKCCSPSKSEMTMQITSRMASTYPDCSTSCSTSLVTRTTHPQMFQNST
jgi:hypothetical protein